ncbi:hypothetical protein ACXWRS_10900, partial [Streptococcus pyogenes]
VSAKMPPVSSFLFSSLSLSPPSFPLPFLFPPFPLLSSPFLPSFSLSLSFPPPFPSFPSSLSSFFFSLFFFFSSFLLPLFFSSLP